MAYNPDFQTRLLAADLVFPENGEQLLRHIAVADEEQIVQAIDLADESLDAFRTPILLPDGTLKD